MIEKTIIHTDIRELIKEVNNLKKKHWELYSMDKVNGSYQAVLRYFEILEDYYNFNS